ncbi:MAG: Succinyl-diaminopimelate desuccinylase [Chlamydiales bacterium]|nr:Succinyl-diaminopimelate desuccinylase [Chlamydiales bacterium]MCH9620391.1 Succinyl-diaminopimelate desuccinylase [Chlamydiales bacterium]MCH9622963.1 Succinyl-diaminopimelate desuccinylase [Chlamydiales bacterium]
MQNEMVNLVKRWSGINSYSRNYEGIKEMCLAAKEAFNALNPDTIEVIEFANGPGLYLTKHSSAPFQIYFGGHLDTVFPPDFTFPVEMKEDNLLNGPGVSDMKGGLVILLYALKEELPSNVGWRIFLNPDEEISSIYSTPFIKKVAKGANLALIFEPTLPDGSYIKQRKGSSHYAAIAKGRAAHTGRNPEEGLCANTLLASFIVALSKLDRGEDTVKVGTMQGGMATNQVSDLAKCSINVRSYELDKIDAKLIALAQKMDISLTRLSFRPPKPFDSKTAHLFDLLGKCTSLSLKESGGVCDGNVTAAIGIPTIDTMGACGGNLHTKEEFLNIDCLEEKVHLTRQFLHEVITS